MKIIDISWSISENMTTYKDKKNVVITQTKTFDEDNVREHELRLGTHTGTHIDAGSHFLRDGFAVDDLAPENTIGSCLVIDCTSVDKVITREFLEEYDLSSYDVLLFKTTNSERSQTEAFDPSFVYIDHSAATYIVEHTNAYAVGIDYLGVERNQPDHETHKELLGHNVVIIEGLRLAHVQEGEYLFVCLPLKLTSVEASPARAVLIDNVD